VGPPLYAAWLRVFAPLAGMPQPQRRRWQAYLSTGRWVDRAQAAGLEHDAALRAAVRGHVTLGHDHVEQALVERVGHRTYICPLGVQGRIWQAAVEVHEEWPAPLADALVQPAALAEARAGLAGMDPAEGQFVRCSAWSVPLAWFVLVQARERVADAPTVRYATTLEEARSRVGEALRVLARVLPEAPTVRALIEVGAWLESAPEGSRLELDYGTVTDLLPEDQRRVDPSADDLAEALRELTGGRPLPAARAYERVQARWRPLQLREASS